MKKEDLMKIEGMTEELAAKVAEQSAEELKSFVPKARFDEVNEAKKNAESQVKDRDKQLEDLKKSSGDNAELKKQIESLQEENKTTKQKHEAEIKKLRLNNAVQSALKDAGAKNTLAVMALLKDMDKAELAEDGSVKGLKEQIENLQKTEGYLFASQPGGAPAGASPAGSGSGVPGAETSWAAKLAEARKNGDTAAAIAIKREAFEKEKIVLM